MREAGLSFHETGRHIDQSQVTVRRIYRHWQQEDLEARRRGSGRATQGPEDWLLRRSVIEDP